MAIRTARSYSSDDMQERRARILQKARELIASGGESNLTIAKLASQADVAPRTIYRAFEDRDGVVLAAVREHMASIRTFLSVSPIPGDLPSVLVEYDWISAELFRGPEFARAIIPFYFSPKPTEETIEALQSVARLRAETFMKYARSIDGINPQLDSARVIERIIDDEYVVFARWVAGRIADADVADELKSSFLSNAVVVSTGSLRDEAIALLTEIHRRLANS